MPAEGIAFTPTEKHLTYSEIEQILTAFAKLGVKKLKLTGGEPLLHPELSQIIQFAKKSSIMKVSRLRLMECF
jgi:cyclic pyranopterin phosphate synthase